VCINIASRSTVTAILDRVEYTNFHRENSDIYIRLLGLEGIGLLALTLL